MKKLLVVSMLAIMVCGAYAAEKAEKTVTIKGLYTANLVLNEKVSNSNYLGLGIDGSYNLNYRTEAGAGLGAEVLLNSGSDSNFEVLAGANYMAPRRVSHLNGKGSAVILGIPVNQTYDEIVESSSIQTTSFYAKGRYLSTKPSKSAIVMYVGGKVSYDLLTITGTLADSTKLSNGIGLGYSIGAIIADDIDVELSADTLTGVAKVDDGVDTLSGKYAWQVVSLAVGVRL